jgi:hypothetical protein
MTQALNAHMNNKTIKKKRTPPPINVGQDVWTKEPSYTSGGNVS